MFVRTKIYHVPRETLRRKVLQGSETAGPCKREHKNALSEQEEAELLTAMKYAADSNFPLDTDDISDIVETYCKVTGGNVPFKNGKQGKDWLISCDHAKQSY